VAIRPRQKKREWFAGTRYNINHGGKTNGKIKGVHEGKLSPPPQHGARKMGKISMSVPDDRKIKTTKEEDLLHIKFAISSERADGKRTRRKERSGSLDKNFRRGARKKKTSKTSQIGRS